MLDGIQVHVDAVARGETIENRARLIEGSNYLTEDAKRTQSYFLKAFCWMAALEPLCGSEIELEPGLTLRLNRARKDIESCELPGVRTDSDGWLVIEGRLFRDGKRLPEWNGNNPLWPLMLRNVPAKGGGPWENFRPQAIDALKHIGRSWP